jgi:hypothetical protein
MRLASAVMMLFCSIAIPARAVPEAGAPKPDVRSLAISAPTPQRAAPAQGAHHETLWIFDADFEDLLGDNAGWVSEDRSGTLEILNYWHKDTIRINGFSHLGDSTWWCGTYDPCWRQPRGYGNDWHQVLSREFPEVAALTEPGDGLTLEYDQRYAIENGYDYGYTDVSTDGGQSWTTVESVDNPGFAGHPGMSQDWDSVHPQDGGHVWLDLSDYAGLPVSIRFRFESDGAYSSLDQWNNPPFNSVLDGAWQLDNIKLWATVPESVTVFLDDCESPGDNGWVHDDTPTHGQTGVTFWRGLYGTDIWTNRAFTCDDRSGWMYAAVDPLTSRMVDGENAWLLSPPIDIEGAEKLVGQFDMWVDMPRDSEDLFMLSLSSNDDECVDEPHGFVDIQYGWWYYGGPVWGTWHDDWSAFAGNPRLMIRWAVWNSDPVVPPAAHYGGIFLSRQRVGIPTGDAGTVWETDTWNTFTDWYIEQLPDALVDTMHIGVEDEDGVASVTLMASNDRGATWSSYSCRHESWGSRWWYAPPPATEMTVGSEIWYYFEALDMVGNTAIYPSDAPDRYLEMSILPIHGSVADPGLLLVDKHGRASPGEHRDYSTVSEDYFTEALDVLGFEYDVFDVAVPSGSIKSEGPDTCGMKYYDTQIWFTNEFDAYTILRSDQRNLITWLSQSEEGKERNLLLTGNDIGKELIEYGDDTLGFYTDWLAVEYLENSVGPVLVDSLPGLRDFAGGFDFMTYDDRRCILRGACPQLLYFDVIQPNPDIDGAELVAEYVKVDLTTRPAGVAYTDTSGYQAVTLGFGVEFMSDLLLPNGHYATGAPDRVDLIANIMEYFETTPTGPGTGTEGNEVFVNRLGLARPNPFNPVTTIAYSLAGCSQVTIRVYDVAGRVVTTLVDGEVEAGPHAIVWDGTTDSGERAASGVYFVRMEADGQHTSYWEARKLVLLK